MDANFSANATSAISNESNLLKIIGDSLSQSSNFEEINEDKLKYFLSQKKITTHLKISESQFDQLSNAEKLAYMKEYYREMSLMYSKTSKLFCFCFSK